jgi:histidinol-phosphate aminotransferase
VSRVPRVRPDLELSEGYHSPQVEAEVRLNTNESPFAPPDVWREELLDALGDVSFHRYPDRHATELRRAVAALHHVAPDEVFCANGSNEVLQSLLLAFGGPGRKAALFEPTYALHSHISRITGTELVAGGRDDDFRIDRADARRLLDETQPDVTFLCSPNNPTGRAEPPGTVATVLESAPGLVVVDEAYGQFSAWSALELLTAVGDDGTSRRDGWPSGDLAGLVVTRTFSKTWALAGARLGYAIAHPDVVRACEAVVLPYHLSAQTQLAGVLALRHVPEMERRVALVAEERGRLAAALADLPVDTWPSDANFILFRPRERGADDVWHDLLERSVLIRNCADWDGLRGCLRVTVGTPDENDRFLVALKEAL